MKCLVVWLFCWRLFLAHLFWKLQWAFLINFCPAPVCPFVCLSICLSVRLSVWISSLHSRRLLQKHWTNFSCTQHHWVKRIKVVKMKGHTLFQGGYKWLKIIGNLLIFFKNVLLKYQLEMKFVLKHPQVVWIECELKFVQIYDPRGSEEGTGDRM